MASVVITFTHTYKYSYAIYIISFNNKFPWLFSSYFYFLISSFARCVKNNNKKRFAKFILVSTLTHLLYNFWAFFIKSLDTTEIFPNFSTCCHKLEVVKEKICNMINLWKNCLTATDLSMSNTTILKRSEFLPGPKAERVKLMSTTRTQSVNKFYPLNWVKCYISVTVNLSGTWSLECDWIIRQISKNIGWTDGAHLYPFENIEWAASTHLDTSWNIGWAEGALLEQDTHSICIKMHFKCLEWSQKPF